MIIGVAGANYYAASGSTLFVTQDRDLLLPLDPENLLRAWQCCRDSGLNLWASDEHSAIRLISISPDAWWSTRPLRVPRRPRSGDRSQPGDGGLHLRGGLERAADLPGRRRRDPGGRHHADRAVRGGGGAREGSPVRCHARGTAASSNGRRCLSKPPWTASASWRRGKELALYGDAHVLPQELGAKSRRSPRPGCGTRA